MTPRERIERNDRERAAGLARTLRSSVQRTLNEGAGAVHLLEKAERVAAELLEYAFGAGRHLERERMRRQGRLLLKQRATGRGPRRDPYLRAY